MAMKTAMKMKKDSAIKTAIEVLGIEAEAVRSLIPKLDENFEKAVGLILAATGKVVVSGMGKSGISARRSPRPSLPPAHRPFSSIRQRGSRGSGRADEERHTSGRVQLRRD